MTFPVIENTGKMKSELGSLAVCFTFVTFTNKSEKCPKVIFNYIFEINLE